MKNIKSHNNEFTLRFRRWSRANYAVFVSLGVCVTIGFLSNSMAEKSVSKTIKISAEFIESNSSTESDQQDFSPEFVLLTEQIQAVLKSENTSDCTRANFIIYFT